MTAELPHSELDQLSVGLREVINELVRRMPDESWRIERYRGGGSNGNQVARELRHSPAVIDLFLPGTPRGRRLKVFSPNTLVIGLYSDPTQRAPKRCGLFSFLVDERYKESAVLSTLRGEQTNFATHRGVDVPEITGRPHGEVSLLLERSFLRGFCVISVSPRLETALSAPDTIAAYPLGNQLYFCANGEDFLTAYRGFVGDLGIPLKIGERYFTGKA